MAIKIPLKMSDGTPVKTIEELREHFNLADVLGYYSNGRLIKWLTDQYYDEEAQKVEALDPKSESFQKNLCAILGVDYSEKGAEKLDLEDVEKRNERRERLREYTTDERILAAVDRVVFTQEELADSLDKGINEIYLYGERFVIPGRKGDITYIGVNNPVVEFDGDPVELGVDIRDVEFNINDYISFREDVDDYDDYMAMEAFCRLFSNNGILGIKLLRSAAKKGIEVAQDALDTASYDDMLEGLETNIELYKEKVRRDDVETQTILGEYYYYYVDKTEAVKWYQKAAEQGYSEAQCRLGDCYREGEGIGKDKTEAVKWYQKAAEQGYSEAQCRLGDCYREGEGIGKDKAEAVKWYQKAADQGDSSARFQLKYMVK